MMAKEEKARLQEEIDRLRLQLEIRNQALIAAHEELEFYREIIMALINKKEG